MRFDIFTLFPRFFEGPFSESIVKRARERELVTVGVHDIRAWTTDKHHVCDDTPYGGGAGMVMKAEPLACAVEDVLKWDAGIANLGVPHDAVTEGLSAPPCPVVFLTPGGRPFTQRVAEELVAHERLALICGHYEGLDERAVETLCTDEISVGDYVLTGGEAAAIIVVEAVARLVPGVLGNATSAEGESFTDGLLEAPQYTRPVEWRGQRVPDVLLSGNHAEIEKWRWSEGLKRTLRRRPDLMDVARARGIQPPPSVTAKVEQKIWAEVLAEHAATQRELMGGGNDESEHYPGG